MTAQNTDKKQKIAKEKPKTCAESCYNAQTTTLEELDNNSPALSAYMRNLKAISDKVDNSPETYQAETSDTSLSDLNDQTPEMIAMLKREAADHIALHIALEDHLMEQMTATQNTLRDTISSYVSILTELDTLEEKNKTNSKKEGGQSCH
jgi:antitoxin component HigA of HigAB toxin-antitoxin module